MESLLCINLVALGLALALSITSLVGWMIADRKLAKYGESMFFEKKEK